MSKSKKADEVIAPYEARRRRALELRDKGFSLSEIARNIGITPGGVSRIFKREAEGRGHHAQRPGTPVVRLILEVMRLRNWTVAELADEIGRSPRAIASYLAGTYKPAPEVIKHLEKLKTKSKK